jgi:hypothetical protein
MVNSLSNEETATVTIRRLSLRLAVFVLLNMPVSGFGAERIRLLIIDGQEGQNDHDWQAMTPTMRKALEGAGRFTVDVATAPPGNAPKEAWDGFRPDFARHDIALSNYKGQLWPVKLQRSLEKFVSGGGGLVIIHAANNGFSEWAEWNQMMGLGWRGNQFGDRITLDDQGNVIRTTKGEGPGASHGPQHEFQIVVREPEHPIMKGMPRVWMHARDELYHGQRGPAQGMHILASAYSAREKGGTEAHEPMVWWIPYGKGRVLTTVMGHVGSGDTTAIRCVGFQTILIRGSEWLATGKVTLPVPGNFPTETQVSLADAH